MRETWCVCTNKIVRTSVRILQLYVPYAYKIRDHLHLLEMAKDHKVTLHLWSYTFRMPSLYDSITKEISSEITLSTALSAKMIYLVGIPRKSKAYLDTMQPKGILCLHLKIIYNHSFRSWEFESQSKADRMITHWFRYSKQLWRFPYVFASQSWFVLFLKTKNSSSQIEMNQHFEW